jgi:glycerol-3-phosphate dehydrogenase
LPAALRGLRVLLLDKGEIASGTTSWSTRLIHGGLRYLEHRECGLVRESLRERERLLHHAPSLQPQHRLQPFHGGGVRLAQVAPVKNALQVRLPAQSLHPVRSKRSSQRLGVEIGAVGGLSTQHAPDPPLVM